MSVRSAFLALVVISATGFVFGYKLLAHAQTWGCTSACAGNVCTSSCSGAGKP